MLLLTAELSVNGHLNRVFPLRVQVDVSHPVVVTTKAILKGDKFNADNLALKRVPASKIPSESIHRLEEALGRTAGVPLGADIVLRLGAIYDPPVIKRGQMVSGVFQKGNVEITAQVEASEDGKPGDRIRVENVDAHKLLWARVQDEKTVLILDEKP
jgi:flagella basal body P-ring formation protein FlgA